MRETNVVSGIMSLVLISTTCWDCKIHWSPTYLMIHCVLELYPVCQVFFPSNYSIISADYFNQMIIWLIGIKVMSSTPSRLRWPSISYRITNMLSFNRIWEELVLEGGKQCTHLDCWCSKFELCFSNAFIAEQINTSDQYNRCCSSVGPIDRHRRWSYAHTLSHSQ